MLVLMAEFENKVAQVDFRVGQIVKDFEKF